MEQHFVHFLSPGTFFAEETRREVPSWDVEAAAEMAHSCDATPFAFYFTIRSRSDDDLDSRESARSPRYYLGGKVETLAEVEARNDPAEAILRANMRGNGWDSWRAVQPLIDGDVILDWAPRRRAGAA